MLSVSILGSWMAVVDNESMGNRRSCVDIPRNVQMSGTADAQASPYLLSSVQPPNCLAQQLVGECIPFTSYSQVIHRSFTGHSRVKRLQSIARRVKDPSHADLEGAP